MRWRRQLRRERKTKARLLKINEGASEARFPSGSKIYRRGGVGAGILRRVDERIQHWTLALEDSKRGVFDRKQLAIARDHWHHKQDKAWQLMESQQWIPASIAWMERWQWTPTEFQASLNVVPGHIRRRQKRKARRAGRATEPDTSSDNDDPPAIITVNGQKVHLKYNWDTDELYLPGYVPEIHLKAAKEDERL